MGPLADPARSTPAPITIGMKAFTSRKSQSNMRRTIALFIFAPGLFLCVLLLSARPAQPPKRPSFVDAAPRSKISYKSNNSPDSRKYFPKPMCGGIALFDFDNDGRMDLFFTNGAKLPELKKTDASYYNCLLKQRTDGAFEDVTAKA